MSETEPERAVPMERPWPPVPARDLPAHDLRLAALAERSEHGLILYDPAGRALVANSTAEWLVGRQVPLHVSFDEHTLVLGLEDEAGSPLPTATHPVTLALRGVSTHDIQTFLPHGSSQRRAVLADASPIRAADGKIEGAVLTLKDLAELERAQAFREAFLARAGHELRNPLAALVTATQVLERRAKKRGDAPDRALEIVVESVSNLHRLVEDLLDLSRIGRGKLELKRVRVPLGPILLAAVEDARRAHPGAQVETLVVGDVAQGEWDPDRIRQLVRNLVDNAIVHGKPPVDVKLLSAAGGRVAFRVRDHGEGVPAGRREEVLKPFVRRDRNVGFGLGLAIATEIARAHGGHLTLGETDDGGPGCAVVVELPTLPA